MSAALVLDHVVKRFGGLQAVREVSMEVAPGERRVIIGPNGAGKTSLFHCISGTLQVTSGRIECLGHDMTHLPEHQRTLLGIGRTFQISSVFPDLTVMENIALARLGITSNKWSLWRKALAQPGLRRQAAEELERVGLPGRESWTVKSMSYGERRQLELVLALVNQPRLLLLDEPCAGLSPAERQRLSDIIQNLPRSITMLMIEHDMDVALRLADRVTVLHQGQVIVEGAADEVQNDPHVQEVYFGQG
jgi:ABC-type branched-subunit amino acid transport system ATPase component